MALTHCVIDALQHRTMEGEGIYSHYQVLQYVCNNEMNEIYSNLTVALRIILKLPVTVARILSKLKLIKNLSANVDGTESFWLIR